MAHLNKKAKSLKHAVTKYKREVTPFRRDTDNIRSVIDEISGQPPYQIKALELLKRGEEKKARRFLRKRLGKMKQASKLTDRLVALLRESKQ